MSKTNNSGENFILSPNNSAISNQLTQFTQMMSSPEMKNYMAAQAHESIMRSIREDLPKNPPMKNPNRRVEELLQDQIDQHSAAEQELAKKLSGITYENMKLNAQIEVLNKTVDSQREELEGLKGINRELEKTNKMMKEDQGSNRIYWPMTIAVALGSTIFGYIINSVSLIPTIQSWVGKVLQSIL